jgi:hypothetical protein
MNMKLNKFVIGGLLILGAVVFLIANATKDASQYFMTVDELKAEGPRDRRQELARFGRGDRRHNPVRPFHIDSHLRGGARPPQRMPP